MLSRPSASMAFAAAAFLGLLNIKLVSAVDCPNGPIVNVATSA